ncbi:MAG: hypothetical protein BGO13_08760 [Burkholderiales bacterium 66-5]|uniref:low temperature requirement protein A n=1 Tax=Comamonas badia TaxID=265291 RepID=UPI0003FBE839|nr:low temperature requirement protein A [Comamonas badia]OJU89064.1 MAG: hypothetical protein BGO13_08760 [Burkholderiales bacterium 66-5]
MVSTSPPTPPPARGRDIHEAHRAATPLELLFDLTFVVGVSLAAAQLHHAEGAGHALTALPGFLLAFFAIWWAWMNYTWFGSAYDNDDATYRVLTLLQMAGVLVFATGVPGLFEERTALAVAGYAAMRLPLCVQWLRAARGDPLRRGTCLRYAAGVACVQVLWIAQFFAASAGLLPQGLIWPSLIALVLLELAVPLWAETVGPPTPWHAHHIAERYSGFVIMILGESILGATNAVSNLVQASGLTFELALLGLAGTLLAFCLWWMYFLLPSGESLHRHRERAFLWGYGHYATFAALAAVGSGLEVVADAVKPGSQSSALQAVSMVAAAQAIYIASIWALHRHATRASHRQRALVLGVLACVGLAPLAVAQGLPLVWGLLLLSLGPLVFIVYNERGRVHCAADFAVR